MWTTLTQKHQCSSSQHNTAFSEKYSKQREQADWRVKELFLDSDSNLKEQQRKPSAIRKLNVDGNRTEYSDTDKTEGILDQLYILFIKVDETWTLSYKW